MGGNILQLASQSIRHALILKPIRTHKWCKCTALDSPLSTLTCTNTCDLPLSLSRTRTHTTHTHTCTLQAALAEEQQRTEAAQRELEEVGQELQAVHAELCRVRDNQVRV